MFCLWSGLSGFNCWISFGPAFHSGETVRMRRLACALAGRLCDKYHNQLTLKCTTLTPLVLNASPDVHHNPTGNPYG